MSSTLPARTWTLASIAVLLLVFVVIGGIWAGRERLNSALCRAAQSGDAHAVQRLLKQGAAVGSRDPQGLPALLLAADSGDPETVRLLLEHGAAVDQPTPGGDTALMQASTQGSPEVVRLLLAHGADVNHRDSIGVSSIGPAVLNGNAEVTEVLLAAGADVNDRYLGRTLLHLGRLSLRAQPSRRAQLIETVRILKAHGAPE